ncbi:MAG: ATP-dependent endonuclease [Candidatus Binatia bacterium]
MAELATLRISRFRSVGEAEIVFSPGIPVVLFGQNNAGKSNIIRALSIILGEQYPKTVALEDSDYFLRDPYKPVEITAEFRSPLAGLYTELQWSHERERESEPTQFVGIKQAGGSKWPRNEEREDCIAVVIEANRSLNYQLSYSSKYTMLSRLMHRFHEILHKYEDIKEDLEKSFGKTKAIFEQVPEFQQFAEALRADFSSALKCWAYKLDIDFEAYNPLNFFHALRVQAKEGEETRAFEELGTGEQQILAISFAHAHAKAFKSGFILAIEEPEAHLHPLAQGWLAERIRAMCEDGLQIILSTHSPAFLDVLCLPGMHLVYKEGKVTRVRRHSRKSLADYCVTREANPSKCTDKTVLPFYFANTSEEILKGFFARAVVLVEGPSEALALPIYLSACGCDTKEKGIAIIPVHGKGSIARYIRLFEAYGIPTYAIFDNDPEDDSEGNKRREIIETCGYDCDEKLLQSSNIHVDDRFAVFGQDFEESLRKQFNKLGYKEKEESVRESFGLAKPLVAREVAFLLAKEGTADKSWGPIGKLATKIEELLADEGNEDIPF